MKNVNQHARIIVSYKIERKKKKTHDE